MPFQNHWVLHVSWYVYALIIWLRLWVPGSDYWLEAASTDSIYNEYSKVLYSTHFLRTSPLKAVDICFSGNWYSSSLLLLWSTISVLCVTLRWRESECVHVGWLLVELGAACFCGYLFCILLQQSLKPRWQMLIFRGSTGHLLVNHTITHKLIWKWLTDFQI